MKESIKKLAAIITLSGLGLAGASSFAAEFEVLDRFSVDGYTVLRGSADIPGGFFTVGASSFAVKGGNVGIGTTGPGATLDVKAGAGNTYVVKVSSNDGTGLMVVKQNGNVGIGSANPDALLTVQAGSYPYPQIVMKGSGGGVMGYIQGIGNNLDLSSFMGAVTFSINGPEMARLANSGNFGIGTTNPDSRLQVAGGALHVGAYNAPQNIDIEGGVNFKILGNTISSIQRNWSDSLNGGLTLQYAQAGVLYDGLSLKTTGNVGIGTTNPGALLHVNGGSIYAQNNANSGNVAAALTSGAADVNGGHAGIGVNSYANAIDYNYGMTRIDAAKSAWLLTGRNANTANQANDFFSLKYSNAAGATAEYLRIDAAGNIGIGTTAPGAKLDVNGNIALSGGSGWGTSTIDRAAIGGNSFTEITGTNGVALKDAYSGTYLVQRNGSVGIGTTAPGAKLEVSGGVKLANDAGTCDASKAGTIRWVDSTFQGCTGVAWVKFLGLDDGSSKQNAGRTCKKILDSYYSSSSGIYWIDPDNDGDTSNAFQVYCDMATDGGGWTLVMKTGDGQSHSPTWSTAEQGSSNLTTTALPASNTHYKFSDFVMNQIKDATTKAGDTIAIRMYESGYGVKKFGKAACTLCTSYADTCDSDCVWATGTYSDTPTYENLANSDDWKYYLGASNTGATTGWQRMSIYGRVNAGFHFGWMGLYTGGTMWVK